MAASADVDSATVLTEEELASTAPQTAEAAGLPAGGDDAAVSAPPSGGSSAETKSDEQDETTIAPVDDASAAKQPAGGTDVSNGEHTGSSHVQEAVGEDTADEEEDEDEEDDVAAAPPPPVTLAEDEAAGRTTEAAAELKQLGNDTFKAGDVEAALELYGQAAAVAPLRPEESGALAAIHANRALCLLRLGRLEECVEACDECLDLDPKYLKALLRRVQALEKLGMVEEAVQDYEDILTDFPGNKTAKDGLRRLQKQQKEKEEELKAEMMEKLKGVGNSLLGNFGLSLDNFKVEQDPKTGGYSINFQQNPPSAPGGAAPAGGAGAAGTSTG